jgi:hypothetical protein
MMMVSKHTLLVLYPIIRNGPSLALRRGEERVHLIIDDRLRVADQRLDLGVIHFLLTRALADKHPPAQSGGQAAGDLVMQG